MLKNIPKILPPELVKVMMEMGHGDELVISDGNFPGTSLCKKAIRCDSAMIVPLLETILEFFPTDYRKEAAAFMEIPEELRSEITVHQVYEEIITKTNEQAQFLTITRDEFYERASRACAVVITGDTTRFANLILRKGVVSNPI